METMRSMKGLVSIVIAFMLIVSVFAWLGYVWARSESRRLASNAGDRIAVGMLLTDAVRELTAAEGFWRQGVCGYQQNRTSGEYLAWHSFHYGSRKSSETDAVSIRAVGPPGLERVTRVTRMDPDLPDVWLKLCSEVPVLSED